MPEALPPRYWREQGLRVILIEKGTFPRQKVCGEFLSPEGADVLSRLGVWPQVEAYHPQRIDGFTLTAGRRQTRHRLPSPGWGVSRWVLDHLLWEHAKRSGVATHERCTVAQVTGDFQRGFALTLQQAGQSSTAHAGARRPLCRWPTVAASRSATDATRPREVTLCRS